MNAKTFNKLENLQMEAGLSERSLERKNFNLQTIYDVSKELMNRKDVQEIMEHLLMMVMGNFGAVNGIILLVCTDKNKIEVSVQRGMEKPALDMLSRVIESGYFNELQKVTSVQIMGEGDNVDQEAVKNLFSLLSSFKINVWISFVVNEELIGGIGLGEKLAGTPYTTDDWELLSALSNHGALAIKNAKFIEQIKKDETVRLNLARYLSPQIVEKVINKDVHVDLGGDRKVATVLCSDIRNFTAIVETRPPALMITILNEYFTKMAKVIFETKGSLDKYIGDAIVAVFGGLIPLENPPQNAVNAAIQMMQELSILNKKWKKEYGFTMDIGIGINVGEVFMGNIGSPDRMEYTVIGDTVNVASRFSDLAGPGQVLATRAILNSLDQDIKYIEHPPREIKGKANKLEVFEIL
jgi:class 3 adenylate cyclase